ncbi:ATP-ADP carrier protein [Nucleospora cyclopteri]
MKAIKNETANSKFPIVTYEEYKRKVEKIKTTKVGSFLPYVKEERSRVCITTATFFIIGFLYFFLKQFKDVIIYDVFGSPSVSHWLELICFIGSFKMVTTFADLCSFYGPVKSTDFILKKLIKLLILCCVLIIFSRFFISPYFFIEFLNGNFLHLRRLSIFNQLFILLNNIVMVLFYVIAETFSVSLYTFIFSTYLNSIANHFQIKRYIFTVYLGSGISMLCSTFFLKFIVNNVFTKFTASKKYLFYFITVSCVCLLYYLVFYLKKQMDKIYSFPLFIQDSQKQIYYEKKQKINLMGTAKTISNSKFLQSLCWMAIGFYYCTTTSLIASQYVYSAYSDYLTANPSLNTTPGFVPTKTNVGNFYRSYEFAVSAFIVIFLMVVPVFRRLFDKFGVLLFSTVSILLCFFPSLSSFYFSAYNFPITNYDRPLLFGVKFDCSEPKFTQEAFFTTLGNTFIKISKFSFYDIIKENITSKIDPEVRSIYKGIFDGLMPRIGRLSGSLYIIIVSILFTSSDMRFISPLTLIISGILCMLWFFASLKLHNYFKKAVNNDEYIS